jgi:hypothetical protein
MSTTTASTDRIDTTLPRPRIRVGAVVWGLIVTAVGAGALYLLTSPERRQAAIDWVTSLTPFGFVVTGLALLGALVFVTGLVVLIRDAQRRHGRANEVSSDNMGE